MMPGVAYGAEASKVLSLLDLSRPGLEKVAAAHAAGNDSLAAVELLDYFRHRTDVNSIGVDPDNVKLSKTDRKWADDGLRHVFFVHNGYQPSYFYGDDINWQYWPVKDNELRWQLHRTKWWVPMGKVYRVTGDEKYAKEWAYQYRDWIVKNPLTQFDGIKDSNLEDADNVYFAWRPLEVCDRLEHQIEQFELFLPSEHFTPDFLLTFLDNYHRHATFANTHYSAKGNHLLFEAQRVIFAGAFFPEFREAAAWRKAGVDILNREIVKQVLPDGVQFELDPGYHKASINIFGKALQMMDANGYRGEFPQSYLDAVRKMVEFTYNISSPDYLQPLFSDNHLTTKNVMQRSYKEWLKLFPDDSALRYFATDGAEGTLPEYTSRAFTDGGFYVMRNGWTPDATVLVLKAGPKGEWHNQFDNGTFSLWHNGRDFFPDSGSYIYGGDSTVIAQRNWFRQTAVHNTLTLDNRNLENRVSKHIKWETTPQGDVAVVETPGYEGLTHRRAVFYVDKKFFVIADEATGTAKGDVAIHYQLLPCDPEVDYKNKSIVTNFPDGNNIILKVFGADKLTKEEGWMSQEYRKKEERPAFAFSTEKKNDKPIRFITVIIPTDTLDAKPGKIKAHYTGPTSLVVEIDGKKYPLSF